MNRARFLWCNKDSSIVTWNFLFGVDPGFRSFARGKGGGGTDRQEAGHSYSGWLSWTWSRLHQVTCRKRWSLPRDTSIPCTTAILSTSKDHGTKTQFHSHENIIQVEAEWLCRCVSWARKKEHAASCPLFSQDLGDKLLVIVNNDMQARTYETIFPYHISMLGGSMQIIQIWKAAQKKGQPFMPGAWWWWHWGNKVCKDIQITKVKRYKYSKHTS